MEAVVFGATGLIGKSLVNQLIKRSQFSLIKVFARKNIFHNEKIRFYLLDADHLETVGEKISADVLFCCLGTTIKKAKTREAFKKVDFELVLKIAEYAEKNKIPQLMIISSIGANPESNNFYLQTKGLMETELRKIYSGNLKFLRPSLLTGPREEFRLGEKFGIILMKALSPFFIGKLKRYKPIPAEKVASAMINLSLDKNQHLIIQSEDIWLYA